MKKIMIIEDGDYKGTPTSVNSFVDSEGIKKSINEADLVLVENGNFYVVIKNTEGHGYNSMIFKSSFADYISDKEVKMYDVFELDKEETEEVVNKEEMVAIQKVKTNTGKINFLSGMEVND